MHSDHPRAPCERSLRECCTVHGAALVSSPCRLPHSHAHALKAAQEEANAQFYAMGAAMAVEYGCIGYANRAQPYSGSSTASDSSGSDAASGDTSTPRP